MENKPRFEPLKRVMLPDMIVNQIKQMIADGRLGPGDRIPAEEELATMFSVGRTSVREAVKALTLMGVLTRTNAGTFVSSDPSALHRESLVFRLLFQRSAFSSIYEARKILEAELATLAARRARPEDIAAIAATLENVEAARGDYEAHFRADMAFHLALADAADNPVLYELFSVVHDIMLRGYDHEAFMKSGDEDEIHDWGMENHRRILAAIVAGDAEAARREAYRAMAETEERLMRAFGPDLAKAPPALPAEGNARS